MTTTCTTRSGESLGGRPGILPGRTHPSGQLCLFRGGRLRHRRAPLRRHGALPRHAQHPVGRLRRQKSTSATGGPDYPRELRNVYIRRGRLTGELSSSTGNTTTGSRLHAVIQRHLIIYVLPRILAESGERFYGTAGAIPAAGGSGPRYPGLARPCKQGPEYDFGALFITYLSGSPHSTAQGTRTIICRAIS